MANTEMVRLQEKAVTPTVMVGYQQKRLIDM